MILMTWFPQRTGRSIRATLFDDDVHLQSVEDFEDFVERIEQRRMGANPHCDGRRFPNPRSLIPKLHRPPQTQILNQHFLKRRNDWICNRNRALVSVSQETLAPSIAPIRGSRW